MRHYRAIFVFMVIQAIKCEKDVLKSSKKFQLHGNCLEVKCDPEDNPKCVQIKRYDMTPTYHVIAANECELYYLQCNNDVISKVVPMKYCRSSHDEPTTETNRTKSGSVHIRVKRSVIQSKPTFKPNLLKDKPIQRKLNPKLRKVKQNLHKNKQKLRKVKPKLRKVRSKLRKVKPYQQKVKPKLRKVKPNQQKVKPKLRKVRPNRQKNYSKLQKIKPSLWKNKQRLRKVYPKLRKVKPNQQKVKPNQQKVKPNLRKVKPNAQIVKPNARKAVKHETSKNNISRHHTLKISRLHRKIQRLRANSNVQKDKGKRLRTKHLKDLGKHARTYHLPFSPETDSDLDHYEFKRLKLAHVPNAASEGEGGMTGKSSKMESKAFEKPKNYKMAQLKYNHAYLNTEGLTPAPSVPQIFALYSAESNKNVFGKVDMKQYDELCPKVCPTRDRMVCAKCHHGIYRSFSSVCHLRMFGCNHPEEGMTLVSRNPCILSSPFLSESRMQPKGRLNDVDADDDMVIRFIKCREEGLLAPKPTIRKKTIKRVAPRIKGFQRKHRPSQRTIQKVYGYNYINKFNTWHDAKFVCEHSNALLFYPRTQQEAKSIYNQFVKFKEVNNPKYPYSIFVGIYVGVSKDYVTIDGKPISEVYENWAQGQPDHKNDNKYCVAMNSRYEYHAVDCNERLTFICKRPVENPSKLRSSDSKENLFVDIMERIFGDHFAKDIDEDSTGTEDNVEDKSEDDVEDKSEDYVEDKSEDNVEDKSEDEVEDKSEDDVDDKSEDNVEDKSEDNVEDKSDDDVEDKSDDDVDDKSEDDVDDKSENDVDDKSEDDVEDKSEDDVEDKSEESTEDDVVDETGSSAEVYVKDETEDDVEDETESSDTVGNFREIVGGIIQDIMEDSSDCSTEGNGEETNLDEVEDWEENYDDINDKMKDEIHYYSKDPRCNFEPYRKYLEGKFFDYKGSDVPLNEQLYKKSDSEY